MISARFIPFGALLVAIALATVWAHAQPSASDGAVLLWEVEPGGGHGCASAEEIQMRVDAILERPAFAPPASAAPWAPVLRVHLRPPDATGRHRVTVTLETPSAETAPDATVPADTKAGATREIVSTSADCRTLDEPLALVIALMIDAEVTPEPPPAAVAPSEPAAPEPDEEDEREASAPILTAPTLQGNAAARWGFDVGVGALFGAGVLPQAALGAQVVAPVALRAHAAAFLPQDEAVGGRASASFTVAQGGLDGCLATERGERWELRPCVGASVGVIVLRPAGLEDARDVTAVLAQGEAGLVGRYRVGGSWLLTASAFALVPIDPDRFVFARADGTPEPVFRPSPIGAVLGVGVAYDVE